MTIECRTELYIISSRTTPLFELPACFYRLVSTLETVSLQGVILRGSESINDPLERLAKSLSSSVSSFSLVASETLTYNGESVMVDSAKLSRLMPTSSFHIDAQEDAAFDFLPNHRRATDANPIILTLAPKASWSNDTFEQFVCDNITASVVQFTVGGANTLPLLLPDCFYASSGSVQLLSIAGVLLQGNSAYPDPLERLAKSINPQPGTFIVTKSVLQTDTGAAATINWNALSTTVLSTVTNLAFSDTYLGPGATLPTFPKPIPSISLNNAGLTGTLPPTLFGSAVTMNNFNLQLAYNALSGTLPSTFLANLDLAQLFTFGISAAGNSLSGSISPSMISGSLSSCTAVTIDFSDGNQLDGALSNLFNSASFSTTSLKIFSVNGNTNKFTGPVPQWLSPLAAPTTFSLSCLGCKLQGPIPAAAFDVTLGGGVVSFMLSSNQISGQMPSISLSGSPLSFTLTLSGNKLTQLPSTLFDNANFTKTASVLVRLDANPLTGDLPNSAGLFSAASPSSYVFNVNTNQGIAGTLPASFLSSFATRTAAATASIQLDASDTGLTGSLDLPDYSSAPGLRLSIAASGADLRSLTFPAAASSGITSLDLSSNPRFSGPLPIEFFQQNPTILTFKASGTVLNGSFPDMSSLDPASALTTLELANTPMDFCSGRRLIWKSPALTKCILPSSAQSCVSLYPNSCASPTPVPSTPPPTAVVCSNATRPSMDWSCLGGVWTFVGSVSSTVITIPAGSTTTNIQGNLTSTSVIINGLNSVLTVDGCADNVTITIELTPDELKTIGGDGKLQTLLSLANASSCVSSVSDISIDTHVKGSSCRKVSVTKQTSSDGTLSGLFTIDKSSCNRWWIILVSVIGGIIILVIVCVLLAVFVPSIRNRIRPFAKRSNNPQNLN